MEPSELPPLLLKARQAYEEEDFEQAAGLYEQASAVYLQGKDPLNAAEMKNNQSVALLRAGNPQAAFVAAQDTDLIFAQGGDTHRQAIALGNQAAALEASRKPEEALRLYLASNELLKQSGDSDLRIFVLQNISALHLRRRRIFESMAAMDAALQLKSKLSLRERLLRWLLKTVFSMLGRKA